MTANALVVLLLAAVTIVGSAACGGASNPAGDADPDDDSASFDLTRGEPPACYRLGPWNGGEVPRQDVVCTRLCRAATSAQIESIRVFFGEIDSANGFMQDGAVWVSSGGGQELGSDGSFIHDYIWDYGEHSVGSYDFLADEKNAMGAVTRTRTANLIGPTGGFSLSVHGKRAVDGSEEGTFVVSGTSSARFLFAFTRTLPTPRGAFRCR